MTFNSFLTLFLLGILFNCSSNKTEFLLTGDLKGSNIDYLLLTYSNNNENRIKDTLYVNEGRFFAEGMINGSTKVSLRANKETGENSIYFFLETGHNYISLIEDRFSEMKLKGSFTQIQFKNLEKETKPIYAEIKPLMQKYDSLVASKKDINSHSEVNKQLNVIEREWEKKLDIIKYKRLKFSWNNPNSYVSIFWVEHYFTEIPLDSILLYHKKFKPNLSNSLYWNKLTAKTQKREPSSVGSPAPKFKKNGLYGNVIDIEFFKGKYVLLDFWASWCKSCREGNPTLKKLYEKYNSKGFEIISVSIDNSEKKWKSAIKMDSLNWHHIIIGRKNLAIGAKYNINKIPDYILIDKDGLIIFRGSNYQKNELEKILVEIFN